MIVLMYVLYYLSIGLYIGSGNCSFDHTVIPFEQRELCRNNEQCRYRPYCIYFHPEGQKTEVWQVYRNKSAKICHYAEKGETCMRAICNFYHPLNPVTGLGFHWDQLREPPPTLETPRRMTSTQKVPERVP